MPIIDLTCPNCGGTINVDSDSDAAICEFCGKPYVVKDAIIKNYITNHISINASSVNVVTQKDFDIVGGILRKYNGESVDVVIPDTVCQIDDGVFNNLPLKSVEIPNTVVKIGNDVFSGTEIKKLHIPKSVEIIGNILSGALEEITFDDNSNIQEIGMIKGNNLKLINFPISLKHIQGLISPSIKEISLVSGDLFYYLINSNSVLTAVELVNVPASKMQYSLDLRKFSRVFPNVKELNINDGNSISFLPDVAWGKLEIIRVNGNSLPENLICYFTREEGPFELRIQGDIDKCTKWIFNSRWKNPMTITICEMGNHTRDDIGPELSYEEDYKHFKRELNAVSKKITTITEKSKPLHKKGLFR